VIFDAEASREIMAGDLRLSARLPMEGATRSKIVSEI
jgi:hypothetical protein